jgi:hypothetical protein
MTIKALKAAIRELCRDGAISEETRDYRLESIDRMVENMKVSKDVWSIYTIRDGSLR